MAPADSEIFAPLLHQTAHAWRLKLDQRLKPMGLSQAKWRTLLHLSRAEASLTQAEIAARLGIEEPTLVNLLHRLEKSGWVVRREALHDRRCKTVHLGRRAAHVIDEINTAASELRHELIHGISANDLKICIRVLKKVRNKAEEGVRNGRMARKGNDTR
ncbi:MAG: MarR family transcriptional regulator, transcriptional regulator for hemolysin [Verrucomicrobiota bacterium]|jgi:MarR family transcriptional regulator for hemolysin